MTGSETVVATATPASSSPPPATSVGVSNESPASFRRNNSVTHNEEWRRSKSLDNPDDDEKIAKAVREGAGGSRMVRKASMYISPKDAAAPPKVNVEENVHLTTRSRLATVVGNVRQLRERKYNYQQGLNMPNIESNLKEWFACASRADEKTVMTMLVKEPVLAKLPDQFMGYTALHWAVKFGKIDLARRLLAAGADINAQTRGGFTPLHFASAHGHHELIKMLKERGANDNLTDNAGRNPWQVMRPQKFEVHKAIIVDTDVRRRATVSAGSNGAGGSAAHRELNGSNSALSTASTASSASATTAAAAASSLAGSASEGSHTGLSRTLSADSADGVTIVRQSSLRQVNSGFPKASLSIQRSEEHSHIRRTGSGEETHRKISRASSRELLETSFDGSPDNAAASEDGGSLSASRENLSAAAAGAPAVAGSSDAAGAKQPSTPTVEVEGMPDTPPVSADAGANLAAPRPAGRTRTASTGATNVSNLMAHAQAQAQAELKVAAAAAQTAPQTARSRSSSNAAATAPVPAVPAVPASSAEVSSVTPPITPVNNETSDAPASTLSSKLSVSSSAMDTVTGKEASDGGRKSSSKGKSLNKSSESLASTGSGSGAGSGTGSGKTSASNLSATSKTSEKDVSWLKQESEFDVKKRQKEEEEARKKAEEEEKRKKSKVVVQQHRIELPEDALSWRGARVAKK